MILVVVDRDGDRSGIEIALLRANLNPDDVYYAQVQQLRMTGGQPHPAWHLVSTLIIASTDDPFADGRLLVDRPRTIYDAHELDDGAWRVTRRYTIKTDPTMIATSGYHLVVVPQ